jgi:hypothetical protein
MKRITRILALPALALALLLVGDTSKADAHGFSITFGSGGFYGSPYGGFGGSPFVSSGLYSSGYRGGYYGGGYGDYGHHGHSSYYRSYRPAVVVPVVPVAPVYRSYYHPGFGRPSCGY